MTSKRKPILIKRNSIPMALAVVILAVYCFTRGGIGLLVTNTQWAILLMIGILSCLVAAIKTMPRRKMLASQLLILIMIVEILIWNNYDLKNGNWFLTYVFAGIFLFWIVSMSSDTWFRVAYIMMLIMASFHAFWTLVCYLSSDIYYTIVYPIVDTISYYSLRSMYEKGFIAGFNYSNSQNAIYLTMGLCICSVHCFFSGRKVKDNKIWTITTMIFLVCLLFTGKRGPIVWYLVAFVVTYYYYHSDKPMSRLFKICALAVFAVATFTLAAPFISGLDNFIQRFIEMESSGDVTTGRIELWGMGVAGFLSSPILGHGWFWFKYNNILGKIYHVHNCYIQWLCELGIIGSLPFFCFAFRSLFHLVKMVKGFKLGVYEFSKFQQIILTTALLYEVYFLLYAFAGTSFYEPECLLPYVFFSGMCEFIWYKRKSINIV